MKNNNSECSCANGKRRLVIISPNFEVEFPELLLFGRQVDWTYHSDLDALEVPFGVEEPTKSLSGFVNFLRGLLDQSRLRALRATWLEDRKPVEKQLVRLIHANSLVGMVSQDSASLIDILYKRRIETWFQPIVRLSDNKVWGYECLLRGRTEEGTLVPPKELIEWARRENLVFMLDRLTRETHLINAGRMIPEIDNKFILINYLPTSIYRPEFCLRSTSLAANKAGISPGNVIFEVVETEAIEDMEHLNSVLTHYRKVGFKVALDDVGSGFASLNILGDLNPDIIKIDMSLVQRSRDSKMHAEICRSLVELGRNQGVMVLAEGVEIADDESFAREIGADLVQGYYIGKPDMEVKV